MGKTANKRRAMYAVTFVETRTGTPLDVLMNFKEWTHKQHLKSYVVIAEMLHIEPNEAKKYLDLAKMPEYDSAVLKRMKELMYERN
ncbi:hypothetical protein [Streptococcus lutetiensis]|uniref:hypothetical protein n=1 Tax=Streptococcus lutetiensis TaxID=150055 RepID=UPI0018A8A86B|nr:hypothetical protein [Streptococcus lutetiensis]